MAIGPAEVAVGAYFVVAVGLSFVAAWLTYRRAIAKGRRRWLWAGLGLLFGVLALAAVALLPAVTGSGEGGSAA